MSYCNLIITEILLSVMLTLIFGTLAVIITRILRQTGLFQKKTAVSLAIIISVAGAVEAAHMLIIPNSSAEAHHIRDFTVNCSMLLIMLVAWVIVLCMLLEIEATIAPTKPGEAPAEQSDLAVVKSNADGKTEEERETC